MNNETISMLIKKANDARAKSYCPYSGFAVGAALLCADGTIFTGANIENASYTPTICAERVGFFQAVHAGHRDFTAIAIVGGSKGKDIDSLCTPCGVCRQVMSEFCKGDFKILLSDGKDNKIFTLDDMLPHRFSLED
jgi:cytidine deaminase